MVSRRDKFTLSMLMEPLGFSSITENLQAEWFVFHAIPFRFFGCGTPALAPNPLSDHG